MKILELSHPLVQHKLGHMRDRALDPARFRQFAGEIGMILAYEACRDLATADTTIDSWAGPVVVQHVRNDQITLVPILRAGLGFLPGVQAMLPNAPVSVIGLRRNEETLQAEGYYSRLVVDVATRTAIVLDTMLRPRRLIAGRRQAGGAKASGLFLVAAPEGLASVEAAHPDTEVYVASIDHKLNDRGYILPGLGDAGDRLFGTPVD